MKSGHPKVLHDVCGRPALWYVARAALAARPAQFVVVVGARREQVEAAVRSWNLKVEPEFVDQGTPLGTGHAVAVTESAVAGADEVLVLSGDDPLITPGHVREQLKVHARTRAAVTILTTELDDPTGYGRVLRDGDRLIDIVEESDASAAERRIKEVSTLVYLFRREDLFKALPLVGRENRQREQYLPDVLKILREKGEVVSAVPVDTGGGLGVNSRVSLARTARILRRRIVEGHMAKGVTFVDPDTAYVDVDVKIGPDTIVQPFTFLQGSTRVGASCVIGPGTRLVDSTVGDETEVAFSVVRGSRIGRRVSVGPYSNIRPGTVIEEGAKAGSFVELKATRVGKRSKVPHLSYVGDTTIGRDANIGAGTVTVNYDGYEKHRTVIGDEAFVGSDTMLVAPVKVGKEANTAAGSVITRDVPPGALAVERAEQRIVPGYRERKRAAHEGKAGAEGGSKGHSKKRGGRRHG